MPSIYISITEYYNEFSLIQSSEYRKLEQVEKSWYTKYKLPDSTNGAYIVYLFVYGLPDLIQLNEFNNRYAARR